jgi:hypothetical protein
MRRASHAKRSDYASYHEVRKAGKKVRYLLEFFEPLLARKHSSSLSVDSTISWTTFSGSVVVFIELSAMWVETLN